jgi:hypothetical protein
VSTASDLGVSTASDLGVEYRFRSWWKVASDLGVEYRKRLIDILPETIQNSKFRGRIHT